MPAYGKNLSPAETTALVSFLATLHPQGQAQHAKRLATLPSMRSNPNIRKHNLKDADATSCPFRNGFLGISGFLTVALLFSHGCICEDGFAFALAPQTPFLLGGRSAFLSDSCWSRQRWDRHLRPTTTSADGSHDQTPLADDARSGVEYLGELYESSGSECDNSRDVPS